MISEVRWPQGIIGGWMAVEERWKGDRVLQIPELGRLEMSSQTSHLHLWRHLCLSWVLSSSHSSPFFIPVPSLWAALWSPLPCPPSVLSAFCCLLLSLALWPVMSCYVKMKIQNNRGNFFTPNYLVYLPQWPCCSCLIYLTSFTDLPCSFFPDKADVPVPLFLFPTPPSLSLPLSWPCRGSGTHSLTPIDRLLS